MTDPAFAEVVAVLEATYGMHLTPEQTKIWRMLLDPLSDVVAKEATIRVCRTLRFQPRPADIMQTAMDVREERRYVQPPVLLEPATPHIARRWITEIRKILRQTIRRPDARQQPSKQT